MSSFQVAAARRRRALVLAALAVLVAVAIAIVGWWRRDRPVATLPAIAVAAPSGAPAASTPPLAPMVATVASSVPASASARGDHDLYGDFQLALGSKELGVIERGIAAFEECFLYATSQGIEGYIAETIPEGLAKPEWDRRAEVLRKRARRCAGFANQNTLPKLHELQDAAVAAGSVAERGRKVALEAKSPDERVAVACAVVRGLPASRAAVRFIGPAMMQAADVRESHLLRSAPAPVPSLAVSLALCDLDAESCRRTLGLADSACAEEGLCDVTSDRDYLQRTTPPELFAAADSLSKDVVGLVERRDCAALFQ